MRGKATALSVTAGILLLAIAGSTAAAGAAPQCQVAGQTPSEHVVHINTIGEKAAPIVADRLTNAGWEAVSYGCF